MERERLHTKSFGESWRIWVKAIDAYYAIVCARCKVFVVSGEANCMYRSRVCAHRSQLPRTCKGGISRLVYSFCRPYPNIRVCGFME
jgi:hypothetical protein